MSCHTMLTTLTGLLRAVAASAPGAAAVRRPDGSSLTWSAWEQRSEAAAAGLVARGVSPGDRVLLRFDAGRWADLAVAYLAARKAGAVPVPVGPGLTAHEMARIVGDCRPVLTVAPADLVPAGTAGACALAGLEGDRGGSAPPPRRARGPAEILYRSGPLAPPVRLLRTGSELAAPAVPALPDASCWVRTVRIGTADTHDTLRVGLRDGLAVRAVAPGDIDGLRAGLAAERAPVLGLHPAEAGALLAAGVPDGRGVRAVVLAGGRPASSLLAAVAAAFEPAPVLVVDPLGHTLWGPVAPVAGLRSTFVHERAVPATVGRPAPGTAVWIACDAGEPVGPQQPGWVWLRPAGAAGRGAACGAPTGDRGHLDGDGRLHLAGTPAPAGGGEAPHAGTRPGGGRLPASGAGEAGRPAGAGQRHPHPVAPSQEGMLWHEQLAPGCQNLPGLARRLSGQLDVGALRRSLDTIVRRHAPLRTTFRLHRGQPAQVVHAHQPLPLPVRDLGGLPPDQREAEVQRTVAEAGQRPFDLVTGPLFEPALLRLAPDEHVLVIRTHHSVFDDWSVGVFRQELEHLYGAYSSGEEPSAPDLPVSFSDFARQQRRHLAGPAGDRELAFWRRELRGAPLTTQLPVDDPARPEGSRQPSAPPVVVSVPPAIRQGLRTLASDEHATVFMVMLTAFGALVRRYTGQDDLLLATVVANRNRTELERLIGCFTKKVPLRLRMGGDPTFAAALARTRTALLGALAHQDLPFDTIIQDAVAPSAVRHGLVPHVAVMFQGLAPERDLDLPGLRTSGFRTSTSAARTHFAAGGDAPELPGSPWGSGLYQASFVIVSVGLSGGELTCIARGAFHAPAVRDLLGTYLELLTDVARDPARPLSRLGAAPRGRRAPPVRQRAQQPPAPPAVLAPPPAGSRSRQVALAGPDVSLGWHDLDGAVGRLAGRLRDEGIGPGSRVGIALDSGADAVIAALAAWRVQAAWVGLDPSGPGGRWREIADGCGIDVVVGRGLRGGSGHRLRTLDPGDPARAAPVPDAAATVPAPAAADPGGEALVFYGAGASAIPQGLAIDWRAVLHLRDGLRRLRGAPGATGSPRTVCLCAPVTADAFLRQLAALLDGHPLDAPRRALRDDPGAVVSRLGDGAVDMIDGTPDEVWALLEAGLGDAVARRAAGHPVPVIVAGSRDRPDPDLAAALAAIGGARCHLLYGTPWCAFAATAGPVGGAGRRLHAGRPLPAVEVHLLDRRGAPVPLRALGELHLAGPQMARPLRSGHGAAAGAARGPGSRKPRLHATGQLGRRLPGGTLELLGRVDAGADLGGFRIDPDRIAAVLARHAAVRQATVWLRRDGDGRPRLTADLVSDSPLPSDVALRALVWRHLPGYAYPCAFLTGGRRAVDAGTGGEPGGAVSDSGGAPGAVEVLRSLWAQVLGLDRVPLDVSYWQDFTLLEALARGADCCQPGVRHLARNRTLAMLAVDVLSRRTGRSAP